MIKKLLAILLLGLPSAVFAGVHVQQGEPITTSSVTITSGDGIKFGDGTIQTTAGGGGGGGSSAYVRSGYSSRFSEAFTLTTSSDALDAIFDFTYTAPGVTLATLPTGYTLEIGSNTTNINLSAYTVKRSSDITSVVFRKNGVNLKSIVSPISAGGTEVYTDTNTVSVTTAYTAVVGDGTSSTTSNSVTFTFVYPFYYGVGAENLTPAQVQSLTKLIQTQQNTAFTSSPSSEVYYFAYPQAYGSLSSIIDDNGFETIGGYTQRSVTMTMLDTTSQNYYIYEFNTPTTQTSFQNSYRF